MKRGFLGSVLVVSLLGVVACGDDTHHDTASNPIDESDSGNGSHEGISYSADGSVIHSGPNGFIDGGVDGPGHTPASSDAGEGADPGDGGRRHGPGPGPTFDSGLPNRLGSDGGPRVGPGHKTDGGFRPHFGRDGAVPPVGGGDGGPGA